MKVLHLNTSDQAGGAAIAACRLIKALRAEGVEASLLCRDSKLPAGTPGVTALRPSAVRRMKFLLERLEIYLRNGLTREGLFGIDTGRFGTDVTRLPAFHEADIIHLHWINQAMLSLDGLKEILRSGKPVVWTLHDMWPMTGICHNAADCERWTAGCGKCRLLRHPGTNDLSAQIYRKKAATYAAGRLTAVGCSRWMTDMARRAPLFRNFAIEHIPNAIDTAFYVPAGNEGVPTKAEIRSELGLPSGKLLLLFTAFNVADPAKGIDYLTESLTMLCQENPALCDRLCIVLAGKKAEELTGAFPMEARSMGYVSDCGRMRRLYQACDLLLMPTLMDNLPNTIVEAMACGVPCVAFGVGGVPQMVDEGVNGFLAEPRNSYSFAQGIQRAVSSQSLSALCRNARSKAVGTYGEKTVAQQYISLYRRLLEDAASENQKH